MLLFFYNCINTLIIIHLKKKKFLIIICLCVQSLLTYSQSNDGLKQIELYYPDGPLAGRGFMRDGKPDGYWINFYSSGVKKSEGNRVNFELEGPWIFYDTTGAVAHVIEYRQGRKNGKYVSYENGLIKDSCIFVNDTIFGRKYSYELGFLKYVYSFKDGKEHGNAFEFDTSGTVITILTYANGVLTRQLKVNRKNEFGGKEGLYMSFYDNFSVKEEGFYSSGLKNGLFKFYNVNGELIRSEIWRHGVLITDAGTGSVNFKRIFYEGSRIIKQEGLYIQDTIPVGRHNFYDINGKYRESIHFSSTGKIEKRGNYSDNNLKTGLWIEYYENGLTRSRGSYINGKKEGVWEYFYMDGSLEQKGEYKNDFPHGLWTMYCTNGKVLKIGTYINGKEDGEFTEYNCEGEIVKKVFYDEGYKSGPWFLKIQSFIETGTYKDDMKSGKWQTFYEENVLRSTTFYENDLENGRYSMYYFNGNLMISGNYSNGKREGIWSFYDEKGVRYLTIEYNSNMEIKYNGVKINKR